VGAFLFITLGEVQLKKRLGLALLFIPCMLAALVGLIWMLCAVMADIARAQRLAVSFDQLANTVFGGNEDETISSRAGKEARKGKRWACLLCKLLDRFDPDHCERNIESDRARTSLD
jgi:hypothetical protein